LANKVTNTKHKKIMENDPTIAEESSQIYPSLMNRLQALFFDFWIIVAITMLVFVNFFDQYEGQFTGLKVIIFLVILMIYEPVGSMTGGTIGYRTMGLKLRRSDGVSKVSFLQAYLRSIIKVSLGWISFVTISGDKQKRAIHDKAAGTLVMYARS
jgi:uncharacterized RDD family membrane protein YckC